MNFEDDRRTKRLKDEQEARLRVIREAQAASGANEPSASESTSTIPVGGITLGGRVEPSAAEILEEEAELHESDEE